MITTVQFKTLDDLYKYYNGALFGGTLSDCIVNMSRHNHTYGFFSADRWKTGEEGEHKRAHEISLNPDYLDRPFEEWHSTLVHEMVHLWQQDYGHPSRAAYHNKEWGWKMEQIGLVPSDTGEPGGNKTGQRMTHYVKPDGPFIKAFSLLSGGDLLALRLKYLPAFPHEEPAAVRRKKKNTDEPLAGEPGGIDGEPGEPSGVYNSKSKYSCPCGNNVWGKPGLNIVCGECGEPFVMA
ncbi:MAG: SprT-like domain-containing protein [Spirochaetaceae bacterium]|jgi:hypothetical protein|nr:SprT-like domain-containing protein [Spirochaetaceae bacterium]